MKLDRYKKSGIYGPIGFLHASKGHTCVLRGEASFRTINGVFINTDRTGMVCIQFRRYI
jgi:hypothetical protein